MLHNGINIPFLMNILYRCVIKLLPLYNMAKLYNTKIILEQISFVKNEG